MVEIAEEFVEAVIRWQVFVTVAKVVLPELTGGVALLLEQVTNGRCRIGNAVVSSRHTDRAERVLAEKERRSTRRAALLRIGVGEHCTFAGKAINVGRSVAHDAVVVGANVVHSDSRIGHTS